MEEKRPHPLSSYFQWSQRICIGIATLLVLLECTLVGVACVKQVESADDWGLIAGAVVALLVAVSQILAVVRKSETHSNIVGVLFSGLCLLYCGCLGMVMPTAHEDGDWDPMYDGIGLTSVILSWFFIGCTMLVAARYYARKASIPVETVGSGDESTPESPGDVPSESD